jgi:enoyl-CoA hydratase/carnithine racemase
MGSYSTILVETTSPIGRLTLNRPEKLNALSLDLIREVIDACGELAGCDARVVVISSRGRAFSAGFDLDDFAASEMVDGTDEQRYEAARLGEVMAEAISNLPQVSVAAMQGAVVGGGFVLGLSADLRVASEDMVVTVPEVELGIGYAWGAIPQLVHEIGPALTRELVMTCRPLPAEEAKSHGLINQVVPRDQLDQAATDLARLIVSKPPFGIRLTKQHVNEVLRHDFSRDDAAGLAAGLVDPESVLAREAYLRARMDRSMDG